MNRQFCGGSVVVLSCPSRERLRLLAVRIILLGKPGPLCDLCFTADVFSQLSAELLSAGLLFIITILYHFSPKDTPAVM